MVSEPYPFVDRIIKQEIVDSGDYGRATGDWKPLLGNMSQALKEGLLVGPFFFHAEMLIKKNRAYNWCIVEIDHDGIRWLSQFLHSIGGYPVLENRYQAFFGKSPVFPNHLPARILAANRDGNAGQPSQVSWFLDQFLPNVGLQSDMQDVCGLELITSWEARFSEIYMPGLREAFDAETTTQLTNLLDEFPLSSVATFAAIVHDVGHSSGPNACLPSLPIYDARKMPMRWYGAMGELTSDLAALALLSDVTPFLTPFILLFRFFYYIREGFAIDPTYSWLNKDYDSLAGALLFQNLLTSGVLSRTSKGWHLEIDEVGEQAHHFLTELHDLGNQLIELVETDQAQQVKPTTAEYFSRYLERDKKGRFLLPESHRAFLQQVAHLPLNPSWDAMEKYYKFQHLLQVEKWQ